jgi:hypothetical protein
MAEPKIPRLWFIAGNSFTPIYGSTFIVIGRYTELLSMPMVAKVNTYARANGRTDFELKEIQEWRKGKAA